VVKTATSYSGDPGSNLGPDTGYHDRSFSWFSQSLQANAGKYLKLRPLSLSPASCLIHYVIKNPS
jgi:hypothetical protein